MSRIISIIDELVVPDVVEHEELPPGIPAGREGVKLFFTMLRGAFPDIKATIGDIIAEGDKVAARSTWSGTHKGELMGIPPTDKSVSFGVIDIIRIAGGKFVEHWGQTDEMGMMQQSFGKIVNTVVKKTAEKHKRHAPIAHTPHKTQVSASIDAQ